MIKIGESMKSIFTARIRYRLLTLCFGLVAMLVASCGGGGGGGFLGAARVSVNASPRTIDTGDRTRVDVHISDVHENGIAVKISYPTGLNYVVDSAFLEVDDVDIDIGPTVNTVVEGDVYLVFYLTQGIFGDSRFGILHFELEGVGEVEDGRLGVDPDVDDPLVSNAIEFDTENPEYRPEAETSFNVLG